jgi:hypothetical protein
MGELCVSELAFGEAMTSMANEAQKGLYVQRVRATLGIILTILTILAAWSGFFLGIWGSSIRERVFPFKLVGGIGAATFGRLEGTQYLTICMPVSLSNKGEKPGFLFDLGVKLKATKTKTEWTFFPAKILSPGMHLSESPGKLDIKGSWQTEYLEGNQSLAKFVLFLHRPAGQWPGQQKAKDSEVITISDLRSDQTYILALYALTNGTTCMLPETPRYDFLVSEELTFDASLLQDLKTGKVPYIEIPFSELDKMRQVFIMKEAE